MGASAAVPAVKPPPDEVPGPPATCRRGSGLRGEAWQVASPPLIGRGGAVCCISGKVGAAETPAGATPAALRTLSLQRVSSVG